MKKVKVIMLDAFKPGYLEHAPYLRSLCESRQHGELNMGFGHWRGVDVIFNGKSEIIANFFKKEGGLSYFKYFTWLGGFGKIGRFFIDCLFNLPRFLKGYEMFKTGKVPVKMLSKLDVSVKKHVAKKKDIEFIYFGELDGLGHKYGTKAFEMVKAIRKLDNKVKGMDFDLIFSDHGMVDVSKIISVPKTEDCFIDSDMVRYWGGVEELEEIKKELPMNEGEIVEWNNNYGNLIFLANTGNLIFPNFWNDKIVKGMHGYDGEHPEMKAFYLLDRNGSKVNLKAEELHEILNGIREHRAR